MSNVFTKLAAARIELQNADLKKSGKNKHLGFNYFELKDFLPSINVINANIGITSLVDFVGEEARIRIVDNDKPDSIIEFKSSVAEAKLQGKPSPIQELGSMHTYMRRYMYVLAYEIAEGDSVDADLGRPLSDEEKVEIEKATALEADELREKLLPIIERKGLTVKAIEENMKDDWVKMSVQTLKTVETRLNKTPDKTDA